MSFTAGQRVRTKPQRAGGHTRLPGYLQARCGVILSFLGSYPLADERAVSAQPARCAALYSVRFDAAEVWPEADWRGSICADLFDEYLEAER